MESLLTPAEVAEILKVHPRTVRRMVKRKELDSVQLSARTIRIKRESVEKITKG